MKSSPGSLRLSDVNLHEKDKPMSKHSTATQRHAPAPYTVLAPRTKQLHQLGLGSAVLASLVLAPGTAAAAANNPIVIDFDQSGLILGWASLWIVTVFALLACDAGGRAMTRDAGQALARRIRHKLRFWRITSHAASDAAAPELRPQATAGRVAAAQMAAVLAESRARQRNQDVQQAQPAAHRQAHGRTFRSSPVTGLPTHHHCVPV